MKRLLVVVLIVVPVVASIPAHAQAPAPSVTIQTEYLMRMEFAFDAANRALVGSRIVINVLPGGTVQGPKLRGDIVPPAGDWVYLMPDGSRRLDVRLTIRTDDNEFILVEYGGTFAPSKEVLDRLLAGEAIKSADAYFITAPRFTTASKKYDWLNRVQAVGKMIAIEKSRIMYDVFVVK